MAIDYSKGYWTDGAIKNGVVGTGQFIQGDTVPTQTPVQPTVPQTPVQPTVADIYGGQTPTIAQPSGFDRETASQSYLNQNPLNEDQIRQQTLQMFQGQIDAINQVYAQKLVEARQQGLGRLGSGTAIQARSGTLGSDFGVAQSADITSANNAILSSIQAEQSAKLAEIMGMARNVSSQEIAEKRRAREQGLESYLQNLTSKTERTQNNLQSLVGSLMEQGFDPEKLDQKWLQEVATQYGVTPADIKSAYISQKSQQDAMQAEQDYSRGQDQRKAELEERKMRLDEMYKTGQLSIDEYRAQTDRLEYELKNTKQTAELSGTSAENSFKQQTATQGRQAIAGLLQIAQSNPGIFGRTAGAPIPDMLRSDAYRNYEAQIDYLKGNIIPSALTAMREASKTGGALGQVSDREGAWLAASLGALSMKQSPQSVVEQLRLIDASLARWQNAVNQQGQSSGNTITAPDGQQIQIID